MKKKIWLAIATLIASLSMMVPNASAYINNNQVGVYWNSGTSPSLQCAWYQNHVINSTGSSTINMNIGTSATTGSGCSQYYVSPKIVTSAQLQRATYFGWVNDGYFSQTVYNTAAYSRSLSFSRSNGGTFRVVTGHSARINGSDRIYLSVSPEFYVS